MNGTMLALGLVACGAAAGGGMYYLQVYGFYEHVQAVAGEDVVLTSVVSGEPESVIYTNFQAIDADSSPLRYRACFETELSQALLTETYEIYDDPVPTVAPGWFECFDAAAVGADLEEERAIAFLGISNVVYGFDRVVAITEDGRGFSWHQMNACGEAAFDGDPLPEDCPPRPEVGE